LTSVWVGKCFHQFISVTVLGGYSSLGCHGYLHACMPQVACKAPSPSSSTDDELNNDNYYYLQQNVHRYY